MTFAFYEYCKNLCSGDGGADLLHMSLQFDGADVLIRPFPDNFRSMDERWIEQNTGFQVNLVEKKHIFFADYVTREAVEVENAAPPPYDSMLGKPGNCILLAMYRLVGNPELARIWDDVIRNDCGPQPAARSYKECLKLVGAGSLTYADTSQVSPGKKFLIHADGRADEPHCMCATVGKKGDVKISTGDRTYIHDISRFKDILDKAIDNPVLLKYSETHPLSTASSNTPCMESECPLLSMKAGRCPRW